MRLNELLRLFPLRYEPSGEPVPNILRTDALRMKVQVRFEVALHLSGSLVAMATTHGQRLGADPFQFVGTRWHRTTWRWDVTSLQTEYDCRIVEFPPETLA